MIKKIGIVLALVVMGGASDLKAQHDVKLNFLSFVIGNYGLGYEKVVNEQFSFGGNVNFYSREVFDLQYTGFNIAPEARFYFNKSDDFAEGFYASPYLKFRTQKGDSFYADADGNPQTGWQKNTGLALGLGLGKKWVADAGFVYETYIGFGKYLVNGYSYQTKDQEDYNEEIDEFVGELPAIDFRLGLTIGWRF